MINPQLNKISRTAELRDEKQMTLEMHKKPFLGKGASYGIIWEESEVSGGALCLTKAWSSMQVCLHSLHG
jgi:hypothetical protein